MRIVVLTWEYPPRIVGETARYAQILSQELAKRGFQIHVVTFNEDMKGVEKEASGAIVHRVGNPVQTHLNILTWTLSLTEEFERACGDIWHEDGPIDLLDCCEWISVPAALSLCAAWHIPFIFTVETLEEQRSASPESPLSLAIRHFERLGTGSSSVTVVKSRAMKETVQKVHSLPPRKVLCVSWNRSLGYRMAKICADVKNRRAEAVTA